MSKVRKISRLLHIAEAGLKAFRYCLFVLWLHLPEGDVPSGAAIGVGDVKDMSQLIGNISVDQQSDAFRALVYPSAEFIPCVDFRTRRCIWLLSMDEQLLLKAVLVVVCRRNQKIGILVGIGGDIPSSLGTPAPKSFCICSALPPLLISFFLVNDWRTYTCRLESHLYPYEDR